jgi:hypothetical protein
MYRSEATQVIEDALSEDYGASITTFPTAEEVEAMDSVRRGDIAPGWVLEVLDIEAASYDEESEVVPEEWGTWGHVVDVIREEVASLNR